MQATRKNLLILCLSIVCIPVITGLARFLGLIEHQGARLAARVGLNLMNGLPGFSKYKIRDCGCVGVAFGHGLYDFLIEIVRVFVVR